MERGDFNDVDAGEEYLVTVARTVRVRAADPAAARAGALKGEPVGTRAIVCAGDPDVTAVADAIREALHPLRMALREALASEPEGTHGESEAVGEAAARLDRARRMLVEATL